MKSRPAKEKYVGSSEGSPPAGPDAESVHVCVCVTERAASSVEACGEQRRPSAKILPLKRDQHQGYRLVSSRIRQPAAFRKRPSPSLIDFLHMQRLCVLQTPWKPSSHTKMDAA